MVPHTARPLVLRPIRSKNSERVTKEKHSPECSSATKGEYLSTPEPVPGLSRPTPEVPIRWTQDPIPVPRMPEAYAAARELFNLSVLVSLAMQEGFQLILVTVVPAPASQDHGVAMPLPVPRRPVYSRGKLLLISPVPPSPGSAYLCPVHMGSAPPLPGTQSQIWKWGLLCPIPDRKLTFHKSLKVHGCHISPSNGHIATGYGLHNHGAHHHVSGYSGRWGCPSPC